MNLTFIGALGTLNFRQSFQHCAQFFVPHAFDNTCFRVTMLPYLWVSHFPQNHFTHEPLFKLIPGTRSGFFVFIFQFNANSRRYFVKPLNAFEAFDKMYITLLEIVYICPTANKNIIFPIFSLCMIHVISIDLMELRAECDKQLVK